MVRKQKTDSRDVLHILDLLVTNRFPRIWVPTSAERDLRQMLRHRHNLVRFRTSVMNQLHALAMRQGLCRRKKLHYLSVDSQACPANSSAPVSNPCGRLGSEELPLIPVLASAIRLPNTP